MGWWFVIPVNPDAWRVGPITVGRGKKGYYPRVGRDAKLEAYQEAVKEWLEDHKPLFESGEPVKLTIWVWRLLEGSAKQEDATNIQKAFEDALQKLLIERLVKMMVLRPCVMQVLARIWIGRDLEDRRQVQPVGFPVVDRGARFEDFGVADGFGNRAKTQRGEVFGSHDGGQTWSPHPLPEGATQVYALACG